MTDSDPARAESWWGDFEIPEGEARRWQIGPLSLLVEHRPGEWRVCPEIGEDPRDARLTIAEARELEADPDCAQTLRFPSHQIDGRLSLLPSLPDRAVVSRPEMPVILLPDDHTQLFIGTPAWVRIDVEPGRRKLLEHPVLRLSDTWFGRSTRAGELAYASRTLARLRVENLEPRPHRILTRVTLYNRGQDEMRVERLSLPAHSLSLFFAPERGELWTEGLVYERSSDGRLATVRLEEGPPDVAGAAHSIHPPESESSNVLVRALGALIG